MGRGAARARTPAPTVSAPVIGMVERRYECYAGGISTHHLYAVVGRRGAIAAQWHEALARPGVRGGDIGRICAFSRKYCRTGSYMKRCDFREGPCWADVGTGYGEPFFKALDSGGVEALYEALEDEYLRVFGALE